MSGYFIISVKDQPPPTHPKANKKKRFYCVHVEDQFNNFCRKISLVVAKSTRKFPTECLALVNRKNVILPTNSKGGPIKNSWARVIYFTTPTLLPRYCLYHLFSYLQNFLNGKTFNSEEKIENIIQSNIIHYKTDKFYNEAIENQPERWKKVREKVQRNKLGLLLF